MLTKLIKYELKATGRKLLPLYAALILFSLLNKIFAVGNLFCSSATNNAFQGIILFISVFVYICILVAVFVVTFFVTIQRFYKNLLGDEGYLMHTLPINPRTNIICKLVTSIIWNIISGFVVIISIFILIYESNLITELFTKVFPQMILVLKSHGFSFSIITFEFIIFFLLNSCNYITKIYASISIGHLFNSKKILLSFLAFIGLNISEKIIIYIFELITDFSLNLDSILQLDKSEVIIASLLVPSAINALFFAAYFFITNYILKNKLNLE